LLNIYYLLLKEKRQNNGEDSNCVNTRAP